MNLRDFYASVRSTISMIDEPYVVLVSKVTPDGGKPGVKTLVARETAGRLIVEDRARLANEVETAAYYSDDATKREQAQADRRFIASRAGQNSGDTLEQFCHIQGDGVKKPKNK